MDIGDIVVRKSYGKDITFKIIEIKSQKGKEICVLKGVDLRIIADSPSSDLEIVSENKSKDTEEVFTRKVNETVKKILTSRGASIDEYIKAERKEHNVRGEYSDLRKEKKIKNTKMVSNELMFGRPGKVLHIDGDSEYLEACLKVYKRLGIEATGRAIPEKDQCLCAVDLVREIKPDIIVITGHDAILKGVKDYRDLNNYRNSAYFVNTVTSLRNYEQNYDDLVIFAGACQSCYEAILDAGANFASSPERVLIHCLDPVFICERIAFTNVERIVPIKEVLENTITGVKGIGGLQTRGKYREGFPKSQYA